MATAEDKLARDICPAAPHTYLTDTSGGRAGGVEVAVRSPSEQTLEYDVNIPSGTPRDDIFRIAVFAGTTEVGSMQLLVSDILTHLDRCSRRVDDLIPIQQTDNSVYTI